VETLSILEKYFRNKFGKNLTEQGIEEAKKVFGAESIGLWTNKENEPAIQLYEKMGFTRTDKERVDRGKTWAGKPSVSIGLIKNLREDEK
jgi:ribosomal protein S18 acetylase RimI-like enzyme